MPKKEINYQNTIIYKICCKDANITDCYVGHTTDFIRRKYGHKTCCNNPSLKGYCLNVYQFIRNNGGWDNWDMIEIEKLPCNDVLEARKRERYWIESLNASLNIYIPSKTKTEWIEENKDYQKKYSKNYREINKAKIKADKKVYREQNKDKIKVHKGKKHICVCGVEYTHSHFKRHTRTMKHQEYLNSLNDNN